MEKNNLVEAVDEIEGLEKGICNMPLVFAEMFKDEINAVDEEEMYDGIKKICRKYAGDSKAATLINEFTSVLTGGASLEEIFQISMDEAVNPTLASELAVDNSCRLKE